MSGTVGIVIVSHSAQVAEGAAEMVRQMVGDEVAVAPCGGDPEGVKVHIIEVTHENWSAAGVLASDKASGTR